VGLAEGDASVFIGVAVLPQKHAFSLWRKRGTWLVNMRLGRVWGNGVDCGTLKDWVPLKTTDDLVLYYDANCGKFKMSVNKKAVGEVDVPLGLDLAFVMEVTPGNVMRVVRR
jgi:hypothetical protein